MLNHHWVIFCWNGSLIVRFSNFRHSPCPLRSISTMHKGRCGSVFLCRSNVAHPVASRGTHGAGSRKLCSKSGRPTSTTICLVFLHHHLNATPMPNQTCLTQLILCVVLDEGRCHLFLKRLPSTSDCIQDSAYNPRFCIYICIFIINNIRQRSFKHPYLLPSLASESTFSPRMLTRLNLLPDARATIDVDHPIMFDQNQIVCFPLKENQRRGQTSLNPIYRAQDNHCRLPSMCVNLPFDILLLPWRFTRISTI